MTLRNGYPIIVLYIINMFAGPSQRKPKGHFSRNFMPVFTDYYFQNVRSDRRGNHHSGVHQFAPAPVSYNLYCSQSTRAITAPELSLSLTDQYLTQTQHDHVLITKKIVIIKNVWIAPEFHIIIPGPGIRSITSPPWLGDGAAGVYDKPIISDIAWITEGKIGFHQWIILYLNGGTGVYLTRA